MGSRGGVHLPTMGVGAHTSDHYMYHHAIDQKPPKTLPHLLGWRATWPGLNHLILRMAFQEKNISATFQMFHIHHFILNIRHPTLSSLPSHLFQQASGLEPAPLATCSGPPLVWVPVYVLLTDDVHCEDVTKKLSLKGICLRMHREQLTLSETCWLSLTGHLISSWFTPLNRLCCAQTLGFVIGNTVPLNQARFGWPEGSSCHLETCITFWCVGDGLVRPQNKSSKAINPWWIPTSPLQMPLSVYQIQGINLSPSSSKYGQYQINFTCIVLFFYFTNLSITQPHQPRYHTCHRKTVPDRAVVWSLPYFGVQPLHRFPSFAGVVLTENIRNGNERCPKYIHHNCGMNIYACQWYEMAVWWSKAYFFQVLFLL